MKYLSLFLIALSACAYANNSSEEDSDENELDTFGFDFKDALASSSSVAQQQLTIINGDVAPINRYPFMALIRITDKKNRTTVCAGTLLTQRYVLSAAHCGREAVNSTVLLGAHDISSKEPTRKLVEIRHVHVHPHYSTLTYSNDIAIFELDAPVDYTNEIKPVQLPPKNYKRQNLKNKNCTTMGWGLTNASETTLSPKLQSVNSTVMSNFECWFKFPLNVRGSNVCMSGKQGQETCNGDSGGPLLVDNYQVGITSFGVKNCKTGYPSVFTRVTSYLSWISKNSDYKVLSK